MFSQNFRETNLSIRIGVMLVSTVDPMWTSGEALDRAPVSRRMVAMKAGT